MKIATSFKLIAMSAGLLFACTPAPPPVVVTPAARVENIESSSTGLPDQTFQKVTFTTPLVTSLITVANRSGTGYRSFFVTADVVGGGSISFNVKEGQADVLLPLTQPVKIKSVSIRCDSFSSVVCQYSASFVGR